jgi:serine/threonine-protein kinase HipA
MTDRRLDVWCFGARAGVLTDRPQGLDFAYSDDWIAAGRPPLSQSLPRDDLPKRDSIAAFFGGLLPEGAPRERLARQLGVSAGNDFSMLEALGGDTAGAVSLVQPGSAPEPAGGDVEWLADDELARTIDELPTRPMHADEDGEYRLSLAGVQDKLPVVVDDRGRVGLTKGRTPSTHILKTPIPGLDDTVANEALCPAIGRQLGIDTVSAVPHRVAGREFLLVERYDRDRTDGKVRRLHQEDFCQGLGVPSQRKYENEGGPSLTDCFVLLRQAVAVPAVEALRMVDFIALHFLVGNHDAHGKNFSLLYLPDSSRAVLAPAYDVLSTVAYDKVRPMSHKMAMKIGGEYRPKYVRARHLDRMLGEAGLGVAAARRRLWGLASAAPDASHAARAELAEGGWDAPVLGRVVATVEQRAEWLREITVSAKRAGRPA